MKAYAFHGSGHSAWEDVPDPGANGRPAHRAVGHAQAYDVFARAADTVALEVVPGEEPHEEVAPCRAA
ncbi:hypothetical protein ACIQXA_05835 [Streptomyces massasporeus]|uniref:hypothetical protein n=1 Tax=Streptomyces massasporeus TaxID=67324 RepID=UPI0037FD83DD